MDSKEITKELQNMMDKSLKMQSKQNVYIEKATKLHVDLDETIDKYSVEIEEFKNSRNSLKSYLIENINKETEATSQTMIANFGAKIEETVTDRVYKQLDGIVEDLMVQVQNAKQQISINKHYIKSRSIIFVIACCLGGIITSCASSYLLYKYNASPQIELTNDLRNAIDIGSKIQSKWNYLDNKQRKMIESILN